jgi:hypothetical protein
MTTTTTTTTTGLLKLLPLRFALSAQHNSLLPPAQGRGNPLRWRNDRSSVALHGGGRREARGQQGNTPRMCVLSSTDSDRPADTASVLSSAQLSVKSIRTRLYIRWAPKGVRHGAASPHRRRRSRVRDGLTLVDRRWLMLFSLVAPTTGRQICANYPSSSGRHFLSKGKWL